MPQRHHSRRNLMLLLPFNSRTVLSRAVLARIVHGSQLPLPKAPTAMTGHTMSRFRTACMTAAAALLLALGPAKAADKVTFLTSWYAQAEHGGFYQAKATGLYDQAGLDVTIKMGGPQVNGMQLLRSEERRVGKECRSWWV